MGSAGISYWRSQYPDLSDSDDYALAERLSIESYTGKSIIVRYKSSPNGPFDTLGRADSMEELHSYFESSYCYQTEIYYIPPFTILSGIPETLRVTTDAPDGSPVSQLKAWRMEEQKRRQAEETRRKAENERRAGIQATRKSSGQCIMCGLRLSILQKLFGKDRHGGCTSFKE